MFSSSPAPALTRYQRRLFAMLSLATFFEGFDTRLTSLVLPQLGAEFGADSSELFGTLSTLGWGALFGFIPLRFADRFGRRPLLLVSIGCYTALCLATAATRTLEEFALCQFFARMFMVSEVALAFIVLSEEMPTERRGRLNAWLAAIASAGAIVPPMLLPLSIELGFGWRGLYLAGGALIVLLPIYLAWLQEPRAFRSLPRRSLGAEWSEVKSLFGSRLRRRTVAAALLWLSLDFWTSAAMFSFSFFAQTERGWTPEDIAIWFTAGGLMQFVGYAIAGRAMDRYGRRPTILGFLLFAAASSALTYLAHGPVVMVGYVCMNAAAGMWAVAQTISAELFPTEIRATASGLTNNMIGRLGMVLGPKSVALLAVSLGTTGAAVALLGLLHLAALPIIARALPETRGVALAGRSA